MSAFDTAGALPQTAPVPIVKPADKKSVIIVGAGIAGLMAARELSLRGWTPIVMDKGRGVGGRMATRRMGAARVDHGAQYFTARDPRFRSHLEAWCARGAARIRQDAAPGTIPAIRYIGLPTMTGVAKNLAAPLSPHLKRRALRVDFDGDTWTVSCEENESYRARWLLLTPPLPQALALLDASGVPLPTADRGELGRITYEKCLAVMATLTGPSRLPEPGWLRLEDPEPLALVADNQRKGVSPVPAVTLHSGPEFAHDRYDAPADEKIAPLVAAAEPYIGASIGEVQVHGWRFAKPKSLFASDHYCHSPLQLALAGDAFGGGRVEGAALSGIAAAEVIIQHSRASS